jgi:adenylate cyclase
MKNLDRYSLLITTSVSLVLSLAVLGHWFPALEDSFIDRLFIEKSPEPRIVILKIDEDSLKSYGQWPWPRSLFGSIIGRLQEAKVVGIDVNFKESSRVNAQDDSKFVEALKSSEVPVVITADLQPDGTISLPLAELKAVTTQGFPNLIIASDDVSRYIQFERNQFPSFALQISNAYLRSAQSNFITPSKPTRIDYQGPNGTFNSVAVLDVLRGNLPSTFFKDKIVLIGATARDLQDYHHTPFGIMSGVEIQANIIETYLNQEFYEKNDRITLLSIIILSLITVLISTHVRRLVFLVIGFAILIISYNTIAFLSFDHYYILDILYPNLAIILSAGLGVSAQYFTASREKKFIQDTFSRYLAPQVIQELISDPSQLKLGGKKAELTILFSDIRGFTTMSEALSPEKLTSFLNDYLTVMTEIILDRRGLVDKYIGDAIMAFWGAPLKNERHAEDAITTAMEMIDALHQFNAKHEPLGDPPINIGIGLNTGEVTVGNMGSEKRFDYTVMGDNVNLASRLEGLSKTYGVNIIIGESTRQAVVDNKNFLIREIDRVQVKGKKNAVTIFEVVAEYYRDRVQKILERFERGRQAYYEGNWDTALELFNSILNDVPNDGPTKLLKERCEEFKKESPENWQGIYEHTHK